MFYFIFLVGVFFSFFTKNKKRTLLVFTLLLAFISFFRYGMGADYFAYNFLYDQLKISYVDEFKYGVAPQEIGFRMMGSIFKSMGVPYQLYISIIAAINLFFIYKLSFRYSKNPVLSMFLYFCMFYFVWTLSGLRQSLTIAIGLYYLLKYIEEEKPVKIIVISILLSFIHASSIFIIALYFLSKLKLNLKNYLLLSVMAIIFATLPLSFIVSYIPSPYIVAKISPYIQSTDMSLNLIDFKSIARIVLLSVVLIYYHRLLDEDSFNYKIVNVYIFSMLFYFFFQFTGELTAARLSIYGRILEIIIFANIYSLYKVKVNKYLLAYAITIVSFLYLSKEVNTMENQAGIVTENRMLTPYINIFNEKDYSFTTRYYYLLEQVSNR